MNCIHSSQFGTINTLCVPRSCLPVVAGAEGAAGLGAAAGFVSSFTGVTLVCAFGGTVGTEG